MPTMREVAHKAGVSTSTVSHVINATRFVGPETEERVRRAIAQLDYRPNLLARSLRRQETHTIGLLVPDNSNPFFAEVARVIEDAGFAEGYSVIPCNSDLSEAKQAAYLNVLLREARHAPASRDDTRVPPPASAGASCVGSMPAYRHLERGMIATGLSPIGRHAQANAPFTPLAETMPPRTPAMAAGVSDHVWTMHLEHFHACIVGGEQPITSGRDSIEDVRLQIDIIKAALSPGTPIRHG